MPVELNQIDGFSISIKVTVHTGIIRDNLYRMLWRFNLFSTNITNPLYHLIIPYRFRLGTMLLGKSKYSSIAPSNMITTCRMDIQKALVFSSILPQKPTFCKHHKSNYH